MMMSCQRCLCRCERKNNYQKYCADCGAANRKEQDRAWRVNNAPRLRGQSAAWVAANKEKRNEISRAWRSRNLAKARRANLDWQKANPERSRKAWKKYYDTKPTARAGARLRMRVRLKDPAFKMYHTVSKGICASLNGRKGRRPWECLVGYTLAALIRHLERQFVDGMSWENHGNGPRRWHIDHIVPRVAFRFSNADEESFIACWALTNLRPLWSTENLSKNAKRTHLI